MTQTNQTNNPQSVIPNSNVRMSLGFMLGAALGLGVAAYHNHKRNHQLHDAVRSHVQNFANQLPEVIDQWLEGYWINHHQVDPNSAQPPHNPSQQQ